MNYQYHIKINAPAHFVFQEFTNVANINSRLPANVQLRPETDASGFNKGTIWIVKAKRSGRNFKIRNKVIERIENKNLDFESDSNRLSSLAKISFNELSDGNTELNMDIKMKPKGMLGRILLQSIKASQKRVKKRMDLGSVRLKNYIEQRYAQSVAERA